MSYSVLTEPVISVIPEFNAIPVEVSLREAILNAHKYHDIGGDNPMERYAQVRFLAAFVMDMLEMKTAEDRKKLFHKGNFDAAVLDRYVSGCKAEGSCFDLFDSERPFMQSKFTESEKNRIKSAASIDLCYPSGNSHTFDHSSPSVLGHSIEDEYAATPAKAFRTLLVKNTFGAYSTEGPAGINGMPMFVYMTGRNLYETIMLHTLSKEEACPRKYGCGTVPWRKDGIHLVGEQKRDVATYLESLTWMPRRIQLIRSEDGMVRKVYIGKGLTYTGEFWRDTNTYAITDKKGTIRNVVLHQVPDQWMYLTRTVFAENIDMPDCVKYSDNVCEPGQQKTIRMSGIVKNLKSYLLYSMHEETLILPTEAFNEEYQKDVFLVMRMESDIRYFIRNAIPESYKDICMAEYNRIGKEVLLSAMTELKNGVMPEKHIETFEQDMRNAVKDTIKQLRIYAGAGVKTLVEMNNIEKAIWGSLRKYLAERKNNNDGNSSDVE